MNTTAERFKTGSCAHKVSAVTNPSAIESKRVVFMQASNK
jgi:hypothetical protein